MSFELPHKINRLFSDFSGWWCIVGGWAIDLYLNQETRAHGDIEISMYRDEQGLFFEFTKHWEQRYIVPNRPGEPGTLIPWNNERLDLPIHQVRLNHRENPAFELDILMNDRKAGYWMYRRNRQIQRKEEEIWQVSQRGIPILRPEIALLYKAKNHRPKDDQDLEKCMPYLSTAACQWLSHNILLDFPSHPWLGNIKS